MDLTISLADNDEFSFSIKMGGEIFYIITMQKKTIRKIWKKSGKN